MALKGLSDKNKLPTPVLRNASVIPSQYQACLFSLARNASEFFTGGSYDMTSCWLEGGGTFGDYNCDSPLALIQSAIKFVQDESAKLPADTFVIWTG